MRPIHRSSRSFTPGMLKVICDKNKFVAESDSQADEIDRRSFKNFRE